MESLNAHLLDQFSVGMLFLLTLLLLVAFIEMGFLMGRRQSGTVKAQASQVRAIMGATLGLLAFMMAFTFATAQSHYEARVAGMVEEVRLLNNGFLNADSLREPYRSEARVLLREFVDGRLQMDDRIQRKDFPGLFGLIERSEEIQLELWQLASEHGRADRASPKDRSRSDAFSTSVIALIDIHAARLQAAMMNRIPYVIWLTLYLTGALSMFVMGYQAGLVTRRSPWATVTLAVAFSAVLMLIMDLDRPIMSLFVINDQIVIDLAERMDVLLAKEDQP